MWQRQRIMRSLGVGLRNSTRKGSKFLVMSCLAAVMGMTTGCGKATFIVQQYDGSPLAEDQVAILRLNGDDPVRLEALDGEPLGYELHDRASRVHIEMLPGEHELALAEGPELPPKRRRFRAEAGKVYRPLLVRAKTAGPVIPGVSSWVVGIYEVNPSNDDIVREISQVTLAASPVAPAPSPIVSTAPPSQPSALPVPTAPAANTTSEPTPSASTVQGTSLPAESEPASNVQSVTP